VPTAPGSARPYRAGSTLIAAASRIGTERARVFYAALEKTREFF